MDSAKKLQKKGILMKDFSFEIRKMARVFKQSKQMETSMKVHGRMTSNMEILK
jgi:preprotein translocase subunit SecB